MQRADDIAVAPAAPNEPTAAVELEDFLASLEDESAGDGRGRSNRDVVFGLLAIPVLFVGLLAAIIWIVPVVATWLPLVLDYLALTRAG